MADMDWQGVARALRDLHHALLDRARREYEEQNGVIASPAEFLQRLTGEPFFAWLRELSEMMVDIDIIREAAPREMATLAGTARRAIEHLLAPAAAGAPASLFAQHYWRFVHDDPHIAMAHAAVRQALSGWPAVGEGDAASMLHERHRLAERARHLKTPPVKTPPTRQ